MFSSCSPMLPPSRSQNRAIDTPAVFSVSPRFGAPVECGSMTAPYDECDLLLFGGCVLQGKQSNTNASKRNLDVEDVGNGLPNLSDSEWLISEQSFTNCEMAHRFNRLGPVWCGAHVMLSGAWCLGTQPTAGMGANGPGTRGMGLGVGTKGMGTNRKGSEDKRDWGQRWSKYRHQQLHQNVQHGIH